MKRYLYVFCALVSSFGSVNAQWAGTTPVYYNNGNVGVGTSTPVYTIDIIKPLPYIRIHSSDYTNNPAGVVKKGGIIFGQDAGDKTAGITGAVPPGYHVPGILFSTKTSWSDPGTGTTAWYDRMYIHPNGSVGINTLDPKNKLDVVGTIGGNATYNIPTNATASDPANYANNYSLKLVNNNNGLYVSVSGAYGVRKVYFQTGHYDAAYAYGMGPMVFNPFGGNVGIGTGNADPTEKLTVKGTVYAQEVRVDLSVPGPDYVFESDYEIQRLSEVEEYVMQNKHLPEVPSAKEMEEKGIQLSEMNMILLKKVEELTLHLIRQEKEIERLKSTVSRIERD